MYHSLKKALNHNLQGVLNHNFPIVLVDQAIRLNHNPVKLTTVHPG